MGKKSTSNDKKARDRINRLNPRGKKRGGKRRKSPKTSPTKKYYSANKGRFGHVDVGQIEVFLPNNPLNREWPKDKGTVEYRKKHNL
jgi:hypothetical protein